MFVLAPKLPRSVNQAVSFDRHVQSVPPCQYGSWAAPEACDTFDALGIGQLSASLENRFLGIEEHDET
jgi:hypothetical protein